MQPTFLCLPAPDERTTATLRRKVTLLALRELLTAPTAGLEPALGAAVRRLQGWLVGASQRHKGAVLAAVQRPEVLTPLLVMRSGLRPAGDMLEAAAPELLAALAGVVAEGFLWDRPVRRVSAGARAWTFDPPADGLFVDGGGAQVRLADGTFRTLEGGALVLPPIGDHGVALALQDTNPLAMVEDHPDKEGNALDLGGRTAEAWCAALDEALGLVAAGLPGWHAELGASLDRLLPVGFEPERHLSASYREAPGVAYLTLHPSALTLAEAIVHETQHGKLNLLTWLDPVLHNGRTTWTPSPVRPDLRPLMGVLLAVHAFVPVAALHAGLAAAGHPIAAGPDFARRRREVLGSNAQGLAVLRDLAEPSALGARLLSGLEALHAALCAAAGEDALVTVAVEGGPVVG
ncbi:MAG: hypothetical protein H6739_05350 [Alphaproteobacteria bacterium]|nr:hypothetical protein [Alphaproteobacteria bacterium]